MHAKRPVHAFVALACLASGGFLAWHYPLGPPLMLALFGLSFVLTFRRPEIWLFALPALLPALGFAPWSGWMAFEELDILVLGAAAGGYAALAMHSNRSVRSADLRTPRTAVGEDFIPSNPSSNARGGASGDEVAATGDPSVQHAAPTIRLSAAARITVMMCALAVLVSLYRGITAAVTADFGWFGGYDDAINSVRIAKSFFLALLLLPLLTGAIERGPGRAYDLLASGLAAGLGIASLAVIWERLAFPGLLNFSTDYRATAMFWEMHVGGAALDGYLAVTSPFAFWQLLRRSGPVQRTMALGLTLIAAYACLATFSRGVYLSLPVSLGLLVLLFLVNRRSISFSAAAVSLCKAGMLALAIAAAAYLVFRAGGYRSLIAVLAAAALMLPVGAAARGISLGDGIVAFVWGTIAAAAGLVLAVSIPKGPYVIFAIAAACCAALVWRQRVAYGFRSVRLTLAAFVWTLVAAAMVASWWGGPNALRDSAIVLLLLLILTIWNSRSPSPLWPDDLRRQANVVGVAMLAAITVAVLSGGAYMTDRFAKTEKDFAGRLKHWRQGIQMLATPFDWAFGKGLGRFPQSYSANVRDGEVLGGFRIEARGDVQHLTLFGPRHDVGFGELLRVSQRVAVTPRANYSVVLDVRAPADVLLHLEICEKHLLYSEGCAIALANVKATGDAGRRILVGLDGRKLVGGPWYAPRLSFFAIAVETPNSIVEIMNVSVIGPDGNELLTNGDFAMGAKRWFFTSDRLHLPWHIKNLGLNVLFDEGLFGLLSFGLLIGTALFRVVAGPARRHPIAPFVAAALTGFLVVGAFDSLLDVPRLAFLFYLLLFVGIVLPADGTEGRGRVSPG